MLESLKILIHQGKQYIPDLSAQEVPGIFRGRPVITDHSVEEKKLIDTCPASAISGSPVSIDLGRCTFCGACALSFPEKIKFTKDYRIASNDRARLIIRENEDKPVELDPALVRDEIRRMFSGSLKLRQVSAGGDNSCEMELNACGNVNFDMGRFGIEFVASPRHADGIVITGPVTRNMSEALQICYDAVPEPKLVIVAGTDAISGGIFAGSRALERSFLEKHGTDLFIPGNPVHPLTVINGILDLVRSRSGRGRR